MQKIIGLVGMLLYLVSGLYAVDSQVVYQIQDGAGDGAFIASGNGSQLSWDDRFWGDSKDSSDYFLTTDLSDALLWTISLKGALDQNDTKRFHLGLQGELNGLSQDYRIIIWLKEMLDKEEFVYATFVQGEARSQIPIEMQRAFLKLNNYHLVLYQERRNQDHCIQLRAWNHSKDALDYKQEWTFVDSNDDQEVDQISLQVFFLNRGPKKQTWYVGPYFLKGLMRKYSAWFEKEVFYEINDDEIGVYSFSGKAHGLEWNAFKSQHELSYLIEWLHTLYERKETLLVDHISSVDQELLNLLKALYGVRMRDDCKKSFLDCF